MPEQASRGKQAKARIRQAFTKLLREKPIQRIAVKELCQEAGVNRSTFYAHYQDIYDLLTKIEEDMLEDFQRGAGAGGHLPLGNHPGDLPLPAGERRRVHRHAGGVRRQGLCPAPAEHRPGELPAGLFPAVPPGLSPAAGILLRLRQRCCAGGCRRAWPPLPRTWPGPRRPSCSTAWNS